MPDAAPRTSRRKKMLPVAKRLAIKEYLPFASWTSAWLMIGLAVGHADAVRLLAANTFVQSAKSLLTMEVVQVLARRASSEKRIYKASRKVAVRIDLRVLLACALAIAALVTFFQLRGLHETAVMTAIIALAIPARHPGALFVAHRNRDVLWKVGAAVVAIVGAALVLLLQLHWAAAAFVMAMREWGGLIATWLWAPPRPRRTRVIDEVLEFHEAATVTEASARRRLGYRMMKSLFGVVLGPFGNLAARTGRGAGRLDTRLANLIPRSRPGMILLTAGTGISSIVLLCISREPASIMGAAALTRIAASGGASLLWWSYGRDRIEIDEDDDDDN